MAAQDQPAHYRDLHRVFTSLVNEHHCTIQMCSDFRLVYDSLYRPFVPRIHRLQIFPNWTAIANIHINSEITDICYKSANRVLPVRDFLHRFIHTVQRFCPRCGGIETLVHVFISCPRLALFWRLFVVFFHRSRPSVQLLLYADVSDLHLSKNKQEAYLDIIAIAKFTIWKTRNHIITLNRQYRDKDIFFKFLCNLRDYLYFDYLRLNYKRRRAKWAGWTNQIIFPYGIPYVLFNVLDTV